MAKVVVMASSAGGVGKTSTALNIAIEMGADCTFIDTDTTPAATYWFQAREENGNVTDNDPVFIKTTSPQEVEQIVANAKTKYVIIDTAGTDVDAWEKSLILPLADLIIIPAKASGMTIRQTIDIYDENERLGRDVITLDIIRSLRENITRFVSRVFGDNSLRKFNACTVESASAREAPAFGQAIQEYAPSSQHARRAIAVAREVIEILDSK